MATCETAADRSVKVGDITFAYRLFGTSHGIPLVCAPGFRQTMDHWDPAVMNPIAARRPVLLIDNAGIGRSGGSVPSSLADMAAHYVSVIYALGFICVDLLGFSMGGYIAQLIALNSPDLVRRFILCGTGPSFGQGVVLPDPQSFVALKAAVTEEEHRSAWLSANFIEGSELGQESGRAAWERIVGATRGRGWFTFVSPEDGRKQTRAYAEFMSPKKSRVATYDRFHELEIPVLIAAGCNDILVPTENSMLMWQKLKFINAQLHLYPDSGHGFLHQYAEEFAALVNLFLGTVTAARRTRSRL